MILNKEIKFKHSNKVIGLMCILGIIHELILGLSRLDLSIVMPHEIFFIISNNYSNSIIAESIAFILRLFILFAVIFVYKQNEGICKMTKGLVYTKILRIVIICLGMFLWMIIINNNPAEELDRFRGPLNSVESIIFYILVAVEVILSIALIIKSKGKVRTIFILVLIASLLNIFNYQIDDFMYRFTPIALDGFIYFALSVMYIVSFVMAISLLKHKDITPIENKAGI